MNAELWTAINSADKIALGFAQKGVQLARERSLTPCVLLVKQSISPEDERALSGIGIEKIYLIEENPNDINAESATVKVIAELAEKTRPAVMLFEYSLFFGAVAPQVAVRLDCGITADCTELSWDDTHGLLQIRPTFGGRKLAVNRSLTVPSLATVRRGIFPLDTTKRAQGEAEIIRITPETGEKSFTVLERLEDDICSGRLADAEIILSGGLGMGSRENFQRLFELAELMGASVGASRAAVAAGYASYSRQVGQTGTTVRPKLYVAFGISGAVQHLSGMMNSARIVAVNTDPKAPIHRYCDYSVIADCNEYVESLIKRFEYRRRNICQRRHSCYQLCHSQGGENAGRF